MADIQDSSRIKLNALCADSPYIVLIDINHPTFAETVNIVVDTDDLIMPDGTKYTALPIDVKLPSDTAKNATAQLEIDNVGRVLTDEIEKAKGLAGGVCRLRTVFRSEPQHIIQDYVMDVIDTDLDVMKVTLTLGFEDLLNRPAVRVKYRPETTPGLF